ncbi:ABC transporter substrate-binding protein [uncultured Methanolobus sp.]|uniref:ABC transporter substrate-binding protein n=1 Tax=uncultured Methanolobus sp. TaxID=218300 RepID=UPI002AABA89E|nr:ABC transporter substrate-binding protein [uncultured Methanolobus sp.]
MNNKSKIVLVAILLLVSIMLSGCLDNSATDESQETEQIQETVTNEKDKDTTDNTRMSVTDNSEEEEKTTAAPESEAETVYSVSRSSGSSSKSSRNTGTVSDDGDTITVTDDIGREITVPYPCERNVFLVENAMNSMYAVGGADTIVGIGAVWYEDVKAPFFRAIDDDFDSKRLSEGSTQPTTESIAAVDPDLIYLWASDWESESISSMEETLGVPVYAVYIDSLDDLQTQMTTFSKLIGKEDEGERVLDIMDEEMKKVTDVTDTMDEDDKPTVYWMWSDVYGTAGKISTANDLIEKAGGVNVLDNWTNETKNLEHPTLNIETLLELNPDVIYMWYDPDIDPEDIINGDTADGFDFSTWSELSAVKNGKVYEISDSFIYDFHSPRLPLAMIHIAKDLYPDEFADLDMVEETDDYFADLYDVHYPSFEPASITITDSADRTVEVPYPVESIVVLWDNPPEELRSLGAIDRVVGIDTATYAKVEKGFFPELEDVPVVGSWDEPDYEQIAELDPDVVIMLSSYAPLPDEVQEKLDPFGIAVVGLDFYLVDEWEREVTTLGQMLDTEEEAAQYIAFFTDYWDMLDERSATIDDEDRKSVYFEGANKYTTYGGADWGCGIPGMIRRAGGIDLFPEREEYSFEVDAEEVAVRNPDFIFKGSNEGYYLENTTLCEDTVQEIMSRGELSGTTAVQNDDVYFISFDVAGGARKKFGPMYLAKELYPDLYTDMDPDDILKEYLETYQDLDYQGVYIYPE